MNKFEEKISSMYQETVLELMDEANRVATNFSNVASPNAIRDHEMQIAATYRVATLAVQSYHQMLAKHLASKEGVELPSFDELVATL